jgi:hypothetical protein
MSTAGVTLSAEKTRSRRVRESGIGGAPDRLTAN